VAIARRHAEKALRLSYPAHPGAVPLFVETCAGIILMEGQSERALRLLAAASADRAAYKRPPFPEWQERIARWRDEARITVGLHASTPTVRHVRPGRTSPPRVRPSALLRLRRGHSPRVRPSALLRLRRGHSPDSPARGGEPRTRTSAGTEESHPALAVWGLLPNSTPTIPAPTRVPYRNPSPDGVNAAQDWSRWSIRSPEEFGNRPCGSI
jgi:hypothetical protein